MPTSITSANHHNISMGGGDSYVLYNSIIARQDGTSQRMSRGGIPQHLEMPSQYHQQQDYPGLQSFQHPSLTLSNPQPELSQPFSQIPSDLEFAQRRQIVFPVPPPPPLPPPPPPPEEYSSHSTSSQVAASISSHRESLKLPPPAQPVLPRSSKDSNNEINKAVDAINALSNLEKRWSAAPASTGKRQQQATGVKNAKRRKRRRKNKKTYEADNNAGSSSEDIVAIRDKEEWIDVIESLPIKISLQTKIPTNEGENQFPSAMENGDPRMVSLAHDFPPLASAPRDNDAALENGGGGNQDSRDQVIRFLDDNDDEMDISDDERETLIRQYNGACEEAESNLSTGATTDTSPTLHQEKEMHAMEKRALKIAELKAKAKLARAKLRMAEEKKAQGRRARELLESTEVKASSPLPLSLPYRLPTTACDVQDLENETVVQACPIDEIKCVKSSLQDTAQVNDASKPQVISTPSTLTKEENGSKTKSLKQKLHLARLKVEIKKKVLEKRELEMKKQSHSARGFDTGAKHPPGIPSKVEGARKQRSNITLSQEHLTHTENCLVNESLMGEPIHKTAEGYLVPNNFETTELRDKISLGAKLEHLRRRQKELKQQNDNANLRHLIHRQRGLIQAQRQELTEISSQLEACNAGLNSKQELLEQSASRVEEMRHRKRIIKGMALRATEQLMAARKTLSERRKER